MRTFLALLISCGLLLGSCQTAIDDPERLYRKTLSIESGGSRHSGFAVLAKADKYRLRFEADKEPELVRLSSCHRDVFLTEKLDKDFSYSYTPSLGIEDTGSCILQVAAFDSKGFHEFGAVDFVDDETLAADVYCNGDQSYSVIGASICQARAGSLQVIHLPERVEVAARPGCEAPETPDNIRFKYSMKEGYCLYLFTTDSGEMHRHTTFGYTGDIGK